jgi:hypothetical protein
MNTSTWQHAVTRLARVAVVVAAAADMACGGSAETTGSTAGPAPVVVASIAVAPVTFELFPGTTTQLTATPRDASGNALTDRTITWSSSDATKATVVNGLVTAIAVGSVTITAATGGVTGTATISITDPNRDFAIAGVQFTQGVQDPAGSIPMVIGGDAMVANVLLTASPGSATPMQVVARLFNASGTLIQSDTGMTSGVIGLAPEGYSSPSMQILVPASAIQAGVRWQVVRDPRGLVPDNSAADDVYPRTGTAALSTVAVPTLNVRFVPIVIAANGNATPPLTSGQLTEYLRTARSVHPLGQIDAHIGQAFTTSASFGNGQRGGDVPFWTTLISELDVARIADPTESTSNWYGIVAPPSEFTYAIYGGFSYIPTSGTQTGPDTRTSASVEINWFGQKSQARDDVAHELGHTFGRKHAPCGTAGAPLDPAYPVPGGVLDFPGNDVYSWASGSATSAAAIPTTSGDVMGYCFPVWASTYTYKAVMAFRQPVVLASRNAVQTARTRVLLVRGTIELGRSIALSPAFTLDAKPALPETSGPYLVEGVDAAGRTLFSYSFTPAEIDHAPNTRHFAVAVPLSAELEAELDRVHVVGPEGDVDVPHAAPRERFGAAVTGGAIGGRGADVPARATVSRTVGSPMVAARCGSAGVQGVLAIDANTGTVVGMSAGATVRAMMMGGGRLTVLCSDGVRTRRVTVGVP